MSDNLQRNFLQARLKLEWADHHINNLHTVWQHFLESDFCSIAIESDLERSLQSLRVKSDTLPGVIPLLVGDAIHSMKAALDYVIAELLGWRNTRLTFPMDERRDELAASFLTDGRGGCSVCGRGGKKGRNALIEQTIPGIGKFITDEIRPYENAEGLIWALNKLDVRDKHRLLLPILVPQTIECFDITDDNGNYIAGCGARVTPGGKIAIMAFGDGNPKIGRYGKATAEIFLNETGIIENQPLFPTLINMREAVSETIDRIDQFVVSAGWKSTLSEVRLS